VEAKIKAGEILFRARQCYSNQKVRIKHSGIIANISRLKTIHFCSENIDNALKKQN
jgi:hypothetical protein